MHYVRSLIFKMHIGVIRPRIRVRNEISRFLKFLSSSTSRLRLSDLTPDSSSCPGQLLRAYFRSKRRNWEVYELDPPPYGTSAENPGTLDLIRSHRLINPAEILAFEMYTRLGTAGSHSCY